MKKIRGMNKKQDPYLRNLQIPQKLKGIGLIAMSILFSGMTAMMLVAMFVHQPGLMLLSVIKYLLFGGAGLLFVFVILVGVSVYRGK